MQNAVQAKDSERMHASGRAAERKHRRNSKDLKNRKDRRQARIGLL